jgi:hypothetical protein
MARSRSIHRLLRRFTQIGGRQRLLLAEATLCLLIARLALFVVPFPMLARRFGDFVPPDDARAAPGAERHALQARTAEDIGWAVTRAARHLPIKTVCLPQAMAARVMLARRGIASVMHFGAKGTPLETHAWLDAAGVKVTGYPVGDGFAEIGCFV